MSDQQVTFLPFYYKELLEYMGIRGLSDFFDCTADFNDLFKSEIKDELLGLYSLPRDIFVFGHHHGYIYYFFRTSNHENNPVMYVLRNEQIHKGADSFEEFLQVMAYLVPEEERENFFLKALATEYTYDTSVDDFIEIQKKY